MYKIFSTLLVVVIFQLCTPAYAATKLPTYNPETHTLMTKEDFNKLKENAKSIDSETKQLQLKLEKAEAKAEVLEYKVDLYHKTFNAQMSSKFWQGFAYGVAAVVVLFGGVMLITNTLK